jgi:hypothetical protein
MAAELTEHLGELSAPSPARSSRFDVGSIRRRAAVSGTCFTQTAIFIGAILQNCERSFTWIPVSRAILRTHVLDPLEAAREFDFSTDARVPRDASFVRSRREIATFS